MGVVRLSQLAREYGTTKKDLMERLPGMGFKLKKSTVDIDEKLAAQIRAHLEAEKNAREKLEAEKAAQLKAEADKKAAAERAVREKEEAEKAAQEKAVRESEEAKKAAVEQEEGAKAAQEKAEAEKKAAAERAAKEKEEAARAAREEVPKTPPPTRPRPAETRKAPPAAQAPAAAAGRSRPPARPVARPPARPRTTPTAIKDRLPGPGPARPRPQGRPGRRPSMHDRSGRRPAPVATRPPKPTIPVWEGPLRPLVLSEGVTVKELSEKLQLKSKDVIKHLMDRGLLATINQNLDQEVVVDFVKDFGYEAKIATFEEVEIMEEAEAQPTVGTTNRPPVVTIMGHVDHGKTSLLDAIRESNVVDGEAGQITQHIGAYQVGWKGRKISFVDTPGHEAFTLMRARGAKVTDIVVLVVAADDGVMPQTVEAIDHARAAKVPIIVAINKIDLPTARADRVKQQLGDRGLVPEDWGGETVMVEISAKKRLHLEDLLEMILLVAELQELKATPDRSAKGVVLEAQLDKGRGPVATVLVQDGTLKLGDSFIAGAVWGKVRAAFDDRGNKIEEAPPSMPVEVLGLGGVPQAGDTFQVVSDVKARQIGSFRQQQIRERTLAKSSRLTLSHLADRIKQGDVKELPIVVKADTQGSAEVVSQTLPKLSTDAVKVRIISTGAGAISETDVLLASASNAIIVGFNVRPERKARDLAQKEAVDLRLHTIIYNITNEIEAALKGLLDPTFEEVQLGRVEVRKVYRVPKIGNIAGSYVLEGRITRDAQVRLLRDNVVVFETKVSSLRRFKEDTHEVRTGYECGVSIANYQDIKEGDIIEAFKIQEVKPKD